MYTYTERDLDRFWEKVRWGKSTDCWEWTGSKRGGYGTFWLNGTVVSAHRLSFQIAYGYPSSHVLHHCDNPPCVNPKCLFDGTHQQNMDDMYSKGRRTHAQSKVKRPRKVRKLSVQQVDEIIKALEHPYWGQGVELAKKYGVNRSIISMIKSRAWRPAESTRIASNY